MSTVPWQSNSAAVTRAHGAMIGGARVSILLFLLLAATWAKHAATLLTMLAITLIFGIFTLLQRSQSRVQWLSVAEALAIGLVCASAVPDSTPMLAALVVPPFVYGLLRGGRGAAEASLAETAGLGLYFSIAGVPAISEATIVLGWLVAGVLAGMVATYVVTSTSPQPDPAGPYREARQLLRELVNLSSRLSGGLDPGSLAGSILDRVGTDIPLKTAELHVAREGELHRLATRSQDDAPLQGDAWNSLITSAWLVNSVQLVGNDFAFPLTVNGEPIAVVAGVMSESRDAELLSTSELLRSVADTLEPEALRLDAASLFAEFRDAATASERSRLAREMHDGVAQEIASMGYVVDALIPTSVTPEQKNALEQLRTMITSVVAEVRQSVTTLRTQAGSSESLGEAIAKLARHQSRVSGTPIQVHVDERSSRLRHEIEAELLRIAQEAMTNAVKHANASVIDVHCMVDAPRAEIRVSDDGRGLSGGRPDSYGLTIMRERAALIGAHIDFNSGPHGGTVVQVTLGTQQPLFTTTSPGGTS